MTAPDTVSIRRARPADLPSVRRLVDRNGLSSEGVDAAAVFVAEDARMTVGTVALERGAAGVDTGFLLRSAAVDPAARKRGIGAALVSTAG